MVAAALRFSAGCQLQTFNSIFFIIIMIIIISIITIVIDRHLQLITIVASIIMIVNLCAIHDIQYIIFYI